MRKAILLLSFAVTFASGCASTVVTRPASGSCSPPPELAGSWKSYRTSSLGPAWMTITFNCDCTARVVSQLLFMRYTEKAPYRVENGSLVFTRERSETRWPFSFDSGTLVVREAAGESHRYARTRAPLPCKPR